MKYLLAYSIPIIGVLGIYYGGIWSYAALLFAFVLLPVLELLLPTNKDNYTEPEIQNRLKNKLFDDACLLEISGIKMDGKGTIIVTIL